MSLLSSQNFDTNSSGVATLSGSIASAYNRVAGLVIKHEQTNNARAIGSLSLGSATAVRYGYHVHGSGSTYAYVEFWYILESSVGSIGADPTLTITGASGAQNVYSGTLFYADAVDQTPANWTNASDGDTAAVALSTSLTSVVDGLILGGMCCTVGGNSFTSDLTEVTTSDRNSNGTATRVVAFYHVATGTSTTVGGDNGSSSASAYQALYAVCLAPTSAAPVLSSATPSGTIATQSQAAIGATTTQVEGTAYCVLTTVSGDLTGITNAEIEAGNVHGGASAPFDGSASITDSTPEITITGLTANTTYYFAISQAATSGDSNILTGSFTTAAASTTVTQQMYAADGVTPLNAVTRRFWTKATLYGAAYDGGTSGLAITCNSSGEFVLTGLTVPAGGGYLTYHDPADNTKSINIPVTFVAGA